MFYIKLNGKSSPKLIWSLNGISDSNSIVMESMEITKQDCIIIYQQKAIADIGC